MMLPNRLSARGVVACSALLLGWCVETESRSRRVLLLQRERRRQLGMKRRHGKRFRRAPKGTGTPSGVEALCLVLWSLAAACVVAFSVAAMVSPR